MTIDLPTFRKRAADQSADNKKFLQRLQKKNPREVDDLFHDVHHEVFAETDCLTCANCCKTTSPIFYQTDIERAAKAVRMKAGDFVQKYLRVDEDNDYVLQSAPCPFLGPDNYCSIYADRPRACREYPHTDRKKMVQIMELTHKNTLVCPAVLTMVERLKKAVPLL
jgi:Fe-S-cluster containining protein